MLWDQRKIAACGLIVLILPVAEAATAARKPSSAQGTAGVTQPEADEKTDTASLLEKLKAAKHPFLLFNNIQQTPGYKYRSKAPWSRWHNAIIGAADSYSRRFTANNRMVDHVRMARHVALAYQITGDDKFAEKAKRALLDMDKPKTPYPVSKAWGLLGYALAYDWVQPCLDSRTDETIRDKLAKLADDAYQDLNYRNKEMHYVAFADYQGQAYPIMGIAACVLHDYTNPNNLPLSSKPSDWIKVATDYLFVNDRLHDWNRSLFSLGYDPAGMHHVNVDYKYYGLIHNLYWLQVYSRCFGLNILETYPHAKKAFSAELWETLPNRYQNNYCCGGNTKDNYHKQILKLFDDDYQSYLLNHDDIIENSDILPHTRYLGSTEPILLYLVYENYDSVPRRNPPWTSHFDPDSFFQVFRGGWNEGDDWLSLVTWQQGHQYNENRCMAHHDQLSFEYYSKGDLLLADGGETKHILDRYYGQYPIYHNTILVENPRTPFKVGGVSNSRARGIHKGHVGGVVTPAIIDNVIQESWMELLEGRATIENIAVGDHWIEREALSSPIQYRRTILYPDKDYLVITDRLEGTEPWIFRNVFRASSLSINPTQGKTEDEVGHVKGELVIGDQPYDWLAPPYKSEKTTGIESSSVRWKVTSPYGKKVELHLYSVPSSEIHVTKHITRIGGYNIESEVFLPLVYFRVGEPVESLNRITVLLPRYAKEKEKVASVMEVEGIGSAVQVVSHSATDVIYAGKGESSFGDVSTDASLVCLRVKDDRVSSLTFLGGTRVEYMHNPVCQTSVPVDCFSGNFEGNRVSFVIKGGQAVDTTLYDLNPGITYEVRKGEEPYKKWRATAGGKGIVVSTDPGEHRFRMEPGAR